MFVGILGTPCSGKTSLRDYLVESGFLELRLESLEATSWSPKYSNNTPSTEDTTKAFRTPSDMLDYATRNWHSNHVTLSLQESSILSGFLVRPFFVVIRVDAPVLLRWDRERSKRPNRLLTLEEFLKENDRIYMQLQDHHTFGHGSILINNSFDDVHGLRQHLESLDLLDPERLRPGWDSYFMTLTELASQRSNCMKRRVGAILVRNRRILATGYNGTPRNLTNCNEGGCARCNGGNNAASGDECLCLHAEENALLEAGRERVGSGAVLYCNTCPCLRCSIKIVQTGVQEVVYNLAYRMDTATARVFEEAQVTLRQFSPDKPCIT